MKKMFITIKEECRLLWKSVLLLFLILTILLSVLFGMLSITINIPYKLNEKISEEVPFVYCQAIGATAEELNLLSESSYVFLKASGYTYSTFLKNQNGDIFFTEETITDNNRITINNFGGMAFYFGDEMTDNSELLIEGEWWRNSSEDNNIWISKFISDELNLRTGDCVFIGENQLQFYVKGIYNEQLSSLINGTGSNYFYININSIINEDIQDYSINVFLNDTTNLYGVYGALKTKGIILDLNKDLLNYLSGLQAMYAVFILLSVILLISILIILHNLFNIILAKRRQFICQLKMLGAKDKYIDIVYCTIFMLIFTLALVIAIGLSFIFNVYMNSLCFELFGIQFNSVLKIYIPITVYALISLITVIQFVITNRKLNSNTIIQEIIRRQE